MNVGDQIRALRKLKGWTQGDLARFTKIKRSTLSKYESNHIEPSLDVLWTLSESLDTSTDYLLGKTNDPARKPFVEISPEQMRELMSHTWSLISKPSRETWLKSASRTLGNITEFRMGNNPPADSTVAQPSDNAEVIPPEREKELLWSMVYALLLDRVSAKIKEETQNPPTAHRRKVKRRNLATSLARPQKPKTRT